MCNGVEMMTFAINVDFLSISFTNLRVVSTVLSKKEALATVGETTREYKLIKYLYATRSFWSEGRGRKPYSHSIHDPKGGWSYFWSDTLNHSVLEFTGRGCEELRKWESLIPVMRDFSDRATRIDVAVDFATDMEPKEFAKARDHGRFKAGGHHDEASGYTEYVGSWKSDRFARVYRYREPHPRAKMLRVEHVSKGQWAKTTCAAIVRDGLKAVTAALGETFCWTSPLWTDLDFEGASTLEVPPNSRTPNTDRWLLTQVLPAIKKLCEAGSKDIVVYFLEQAYNTLNEKE